MTVRTFGRRKQFRSCLYAAAASLALLPSTALAQTSTEEPPSPASSEAEPERQSENKSENKSENEIIVTATRQGQTVQDAPISVSVIDERLIKGSGATNFSEVATLIPSVVFSQQQSPIQSNVGIRGVTTAGGSAALEPSVGIYVDGVFTDRTAIGIGDFNDIERIEVLRGPQGTLFGNSSPAGVINFVTKRPSRTFGGDFEGTIGNFNRRQIAGSVTGPIVEDKLFFRISAFSHDRDGYLRNLVGPDVNDQNSWGVRAKLLVEPTSNLTFTLTGEYGKTDSICCAPVIDNVSQATLDRFATASQEFPFRGAGVPFPENQLQDQVVAINGDQRFKSATRSLYLDASWDLGDNRLSSITAYRRFSTFGRQDLDFTALNLLDFPQVNRDQDQFSQELRLSSTGRRRLSYLVGAYFFQKEAEEDTKRGLVINPALVARLPSLFAATTPSGSQIRNRNLAVFGELGFAVTDRLKLTGGLRYNHDDKHITAFASRLRANGTPLSPTQTIPEQFQNKDGGQLTGRAILEYDFTRNIQTYLSYTRGYKAFGINDDANLLRNIPGASFFFDSEKVDNYEAGLKTYFPKQRLTANIVLFNTVYKDFQSLSSFTSNNQLRFFLQNAASLTSRGAEIDIAWRPSRRFFLQSSATLLDARFDSFPAAEGPTGPRDLSGERLRDAPKLSTSLVAQYTQPLTSKLEAFVRGDLFYRSKVFTNQNLDPLEVQGAYTKINARIGIGDPDGKWSAEAFVRNLTDEITFGRAGVPTFGAFNAVLPAIGIPALPVGSARLRFVGEPRTFGLTLRYRL